MIKRNQFLNSITIYIYILHKNVYVKLSIYQNIIPTTRFEKKVSISTEREEASEWNYRKYAIYNRGIYSIYGTRCIQMVFSRRYQVSRRQVNKREWGRGV